jgi:hypothetical protein
MPSVIEAPSAPAAQMAPRADEYISVINFNDSRLFHTNKSQRNQVLDKLKANSTWNNLHKVWNYQSNSYLDKQAIEKWGLLDLRRIPSAKPLQKRCVTQ